MRKLRQAYLDLPIKYKLIYFFLPLSIIPIIIITIFSTNVYKHTVYNRAFSNLDDNSRLITRRIEGIMTNTVNCSNMLTININRVIEQENQNHSMSKLSLYNAISNELAYGMLLFTDIDSIVFVDKNNLIHYTDLKLLNNHYKFDSSEMKNKVCSTTGISLWFPMEKRDYFVTDPKEPVVTLGKKVLNIKTGKTLGYLFINLKQSTLSSIFRNQDNNYFIVDETNKVISSVDYASLLKPIENPKLKSFVGSELQSEIIKIKDIEIVVTNTKFKNLRWSLISQVKLTDIMHDLEKTNFTILILVIILIIFEIFVCTLIAYMITNQMDKLKIGMKKISTGDFNFKIKINSKDEIGVFAHGFNKMAEKIRDLLKNVKVEQKNKHEYQLALIQSQIKPHFLYNCLDVIYTLSDMGRTKEAKKTTKALADFYRGTLSSGSEIITIKEEIKIVKDYLSLMRYQYSDVFDYEIDVDSEIMNFHILKLTLQPLVENAIYHGLKPCDNFGQIRIMGFFERENITLKVIDNGVGMSEKQLIRLKNNIKERQKEHFGICNVQHRMKLFFGEKAKVEIDSKLNQGTCITINIPMIKGADEVD